MKPGFVGGDGSIGCDSHSQEGGIYPQFNSTGRVNDGEFCSEPSADDSMELEANNM